ncbi:hypothetical protein LUZ60_006957 [Juncus effusus]|nr:hypothetical protein LUZ60_006957 [Juncus effusus]
MLPGFLAHVHRVLDYVTSLLQSTGGTFVFHGPGMVYLLTSNPTDMRYMFVENFQNYPKGKDFIEIFDIAGDGIFNTDGDLWKFQRAKAKSLLTNPSFRTFNARMSREKVENALLPYLADSASKGLLVDMQDILFRLMFDISTNFIFGVDLHSLSLDLPVIPFVKAADDATASIFFRVYTPAFWWKLLRWFGIGSEKKMAEAQRIGYIFMTETIETRRNEMASRKDQSINFLSSYMADNEIPKSDKFLRESLVNLLIAGRDTNSSGMTWMLWLLSQNPCVEEKILQELSSIPQSSTSDSDGMVVFNPAELDKIAYLHAAVLESLRLFPPLPFNLKGVEKPDVLPSGTMTTPNMKIIVCIYAMGRMETIWGKDCMEFKPERWISNDGKLKYEPSYKFLTFHTGLRTCLGKDMALMQIKTTVAAMIYNFHFEVVKGHVIEPRLSTILHMKNGLMMNVKKRTNIV